MCRRYPLSGTLLLLATVALSLSAQTEAPRPDWRRIGNAALELSLPSVASGPVERVWYSVDGSQLFALTLTGKTLVTNDFETWTAAPAELAAPITPPQIDVQSRPEARVLVRGQQADRARLYAIGNYVYRSDDGGIKWSSLTNFKGISILGNGMVDLAVSPRDPDEISVASQTGIWRSVDGGQSWTGLNQALPNIPVRRILGTPRNTRGTRVAVDFNSILSAFEWQPGEKQAWRLVEDTEFERDQQLRRSLSQTLGGRITAMATGGDYIYAGSADGRMWVSRDRGRSWIANADQYAGPVEALYIDPRDPRLALAALGARSPMAAPAARASHLLRTTNGGGFWDDLTANLPDVAAYGVAADRPSGAVYVATERGVFLSFQDLTGAGPAVAWTALAAALPEARATDVRLDPFGHQLFVALDGYGVFAAPAPHRFRFPGVVSAADLTERAAAPGALLTVLGANVRSAKAGGLESPVLDANASKSEIQVPFEATGTSLSLALEAAGGSLTFGLPLHSAAPAVFVDGDGAPMVLDADSGVLLDPMRPAHSNSRIQILATGLGQVRPQWPSGVPAPRENPPAVIAPVRAFLDRVPVEVSRATLAPGYVGFYIIEIQVPKLVNYGPAELYLEVDGRPSNRVRVYIEP